MIWAEKRFKLGYGRAFALYVMAYCVGRVWIEYLRVDTANHLFGVRINVFTSIILFLLALAFFVIQGRRHPGLQLIAVADGVVPDGQAVPARRGRTGWRSRIAGRGGTGGRRGTGG